MLPAPLAELWRSWLTTYKELAERNPPLALYYAMREISETNDYSSWPRGFERRILEWIDDGDWAAFPFYDYNGIATQEFFQQLKAAREKSDGWLFWDDQMGKIVYAPWDIWAERCREQDRLKPSGNRL